MGSDFRLAIRMLLRDWHAGELKVLLLALLISVASMTSISLFIQRIELAMLDQTGEFLGANLIIESPQPLQTGIRQELDRQKLRSSDIISFSSVIVSNDQFQLTHIKAVDQHYPLLNTIRISTQQYGEEQHSHAGPPRGQVWLAPRLLNLLNIKLGDTLEIGNAKFIASAILKYDPGQAFGFMSIAPKLLMHIDDVASTGIIQPGSRISYLLAVSGDEQKHNAFAKWLKPQLTSSQKLIGGTEGSVAINSAVVKSKQYLSLASMLSVMLSGIAIAMAANRYGERHYNQAALMRCIGAQQKNILRIFSQQLLLIGVIGCTLGIMVGYFTQMGIVYLLQDLLNKQLPQAYLWPLLNGFLSGLITLCGFSLPAILRLKSIPPLKVLRDELTPLSLSSRLVYALAISTIIAVMWWQSGSLKLTVIVLLGTIVCAIVLYLISFLLFSLSKALIPVFSGPYKVGLQQLLRNKKLNLLLLLSLGLSFMVLMLILLIRNDLIQRWQNQLPDNAPNHFMVNIQPYEVNPVSQFLTKHNIKSEGLYPMVRGRIIKINAESINDITDSEVKMDNAFKRELNLSWNTEIQANNQLIEGNWWNPQLQTMPFISIEEGLAKRLKLNIGDSLTFKIADQEISASVLNIRRVQWDSFQPNFFIIFSPGIIDEFPVTYISSFHLAKQNKNILNRLVRQFPTITVLEIDDIMLQVKSIMQQVSTTIGYVMLFVLSAGIIVLAAAMQSSMDKRLHAATIMRTLGASKLFMIKSQLVEFATLGYLSGLLAIIATELVAYVLYTQIFNLSFELHTQLWIYGPITSSVLISLISYFYLRKVARLSPVKILRYG